MKWVSILGSTGSIGKNSLKIIDRKKKFFKIYLLSANKNYKLINLQIKKYNPKVFIINDREIFEKFKKKFNKKKIKILNDINKLSINKKIDITISAIPGIAGLKPTLKMIKKSKKILVANKESIICGWSLIKSRANKYKTKIIPVDSEHYSVLKLIEDHNKHEIDKIFITASGGPFLNLKTSKFKNIKPKDALKHPKWKMGKKISIDSSNLMNKILEIIEAEKIFDLPQNKLDILIHPESLVHAIVVFKNGLAKFIYHQTSMLIPLANAIFDGKINIKDFLNIKNTIKNKNFIENLTFKKVDTKIFPIYKLKKRVNEYPSTPIIINAVNEILVDHFLRKKIPFLSFYKIIMTILNDRNYRKYAIKVPKNINQINNIDLWARKKAKERIRF
tara:strand:+ start:758 stop:1927 length:1170 start_codon:yes stop_codon:yes gene_type:complete